MNKRTIDIIASTMDRGGAERVISILANHWSELGYKVKIILLLGYNSGYKLNPDVKILSLVNKDLSRWKQIPFWIRHIRSTVKKDEPAFVLSFFPKNTIISWIATRSLGIKLRFISSERNDPRFDGRGKLTAFLSEFVYSKSNAVVFQTTLLKSLYKRCNPKKTFVIPNPINEKVFLKACNIRKTGKIVSVGKLEPQKNQKLLIDAFSVYSRSFPEAHLEIYGVGSLKKELCNYISSLNLQNKVILKGNVPNLHSEIRDAEMFVLTSNYEGFSNALMESLALGIPTISTDCAGATDLIDDRENGLIVPVGGLQELIQAMKCLSLNQSLADYFSSKSKETIQQFKSSIILPLWDKACFGDCDPD